MDERDPLLSEAYRAADHPEPPAELDARILDAARRAVAPAPRRRRWFAWAAPLATTAVLVLGLSMLLRIREEAPEALREALPPPPATRSESASATSPATPVEPMAQPAPAAKASDAAGLPRAAGGAAKSVEARSVPAPAPAPAALAPAPATQVASPEATAAPQAVPEPRPFPAPAVSLPQLEALRPAPAASPAPQQADRLQRMAPAAAPAGEAAPAFNQGMSKLKAASPAVESPEQWVERIRQLLRENRGEEARRALAELRRRYPAFELPEDLRAIR